MRIQLLISTINQTDYTLLDRMQIFCDTIVINQCDSVGIELFEYNGHKVEWYNCTERGVGKSRNKALMAATADICVFADDDMIYNNETMETINAVFEEYPKADLIAFNVHGACANSKNHVLHTWNAYKYATYRLAVKRESILKTRICFSLLFGGGAQYSCGEDTLFIRDCLKNKLRLYAVTNYIGTNSFGESTWFHGYTEKLFVDKGVLYATMNPILAKMYCVRFAFRHSNIFSHEVSREQALKWMLKGVDEAKSRM